MKQNIFTILMLLVLSLTSCELAGDIFKGGMWVGALLVIGIIGVLLYFFTKNRN